MLVTPHIMDWLIWGSQSLWGLLLPQPLVRGGQFEPFLVECFQRLEGEFRGIFEELAEDPRRHPGSAPEP